jgi:hypothetical protein
MSDYWEPTEDNEEELLKEWNSSRKGGDEDYDIPGFEDIEIPIREGTRENIELVRKKNDEIATSPSTPMR